MPTLVRITASERGILKTRLLRGALEGEGPVDRTLIIEYDGDIWQMPGLHDGRLKMEQLAAACPGVRQPWIPGEGIFPATVQIGNPSIVTLTFPV